MASTDERIETLRAEIHERQNELRTLTQPPRECYICGRDDDATYLTDFTIEVNVGEEGYQHVRQYRCEEHVGRLVDLVTLAGFVTHEHGSTAYLEDITCSGVDIDSYVCPTPTRYGLVTLRHKGVPWQADDDA